MRTRCFLLLSAACLSGLPSATAGEPSADDLIKMAPVLDSSDPKVKSIEVGGTVGADGFRVKYRSIYRAPDQFALVLSDISDGTPLLFAAHEKALVYDPVRPVVLQISPAHIFTKMWQEGDSLKFHWGWETGQGKTSKIRLDIKSLFNGPVEKDEVSQLGEGRYRLIRTFETGHQLSCVVEPGQVCPFTKVEIVDRDTREVAFCIDRIEADAPLKDGEFIFPDRALLAEKIEVRDHPGDGLAQNLVGMGLIFRAAYARVAAKEPELRENIPFPGFSNIDWEKVKENDQKYSAVLKKLLPTAPDR